MWHGWQYPQRGFVFAKAATEHKPSFPEEFLGLQVTTSVQSWQGYGEGEVCVGVGGVGRDSTLVEKIPVAFLSHRQRFLQFGLSQRVALWGSWFISFSACNWIQGAISYLLRAIKTQGSGYEFWQLSTPLTQRPLTLLWFSILKSIPTLEGFIFF